jgi:CheY-like chemotaxis protein
MPLESGIRRSGATCRVLVVEDNFDSAERLCSLIQQAGHDCRVALDATEARAITEEYTPDLALIDVGLPGETGYALVHDLQKQPALVDCQFVALTGHAGSETLERSDAGFEAHLTTPVPLDLLRVVLEQCAARSTVLFARPAS